MPIKKSLKIAGAILLAFFILYLGLMIVLSGLGKKSPLPPRQGLNIYDGSGVGVSGIFRPGAPSAKQSGGFSGDIAPDSDMGVRRDAAVSPTAAAIDKKIIKTGNLSLKVEQAETAAESIANIAKLNQGEVASSNFYESVRGVKSGSITVRVPYRNFEAAFNEIKKVSTQVVSESTSAQDITEQFIDLEARLKNKRAEEASFAALLSRSGKIEEILSVTRELARTRGEIEQLEGQLRYLNEQTDMSTITANLTEDAAISPAGQDWRPWQMVKTSVKRLITSGQNFIDGLIAFLIVVLPLLIIYGLIIWLIYFIGKKIYRRYIKKY